MQRSNAIKELDKRRAAVEALQEELRSAEKEMDATTEARNKGAKQSKDSEQDKNSVEARTHALIDLASSHTAAVTAAQNARKAAEEDLARLNKGIFVPPSAINKEAEANTEKFHPRNQDDIARVESLVSDDALKVQSDRLEKLRRAAVQEAEELNMDSLAQALAAVRENSVERAQQPGYVPYESEDMKSLLDEKREVQGLSDSLDQWLGVPDSGLSKRVSQLSQAFPKNMQAQAKQSEPYQAQISQDRREKGSPMGSGPEKAVRKPSGLDREPAPLRSRSNSRVETESDEQYKAMTEVDVLKEELSKLRQQMQQAQLAQAAPPSSQYPPHMMPMQGGVPNPAYMHPYMQHPMQAQMQPNPFFPPPNYYPYPNPMQPASQMPFPMRDPMQEAFLMQMQKISEAMEKENKELMAQLNGDNRGGLMNIQEKGATSRNISGSQNDGLNRDRIRSDSRHRKIEAEETKYTDDIRILDLEMEKVRKQVELDELKYDTEKRIAQRRAEDEHTKWVESQKKELQAMKMKQAILKEQRILDMQQKALQGNDGQQGESSAENKQATAVQDPLDMKREEAGVGNTPLPLDLAKGYSVMVDAIVIPESAAHELADAGGGTFRVVVAIYDKKGEAITALAACKWMNWEGHMSGNNQAESNKIASNAAAILNLSQKSADDISLSSSVKEGSLAGSASLGSLSEDKKEDMHVFTVLPVSAKKILKATERKLHSDDRVLVEIQIKPKGQDETSLGWSLMRLVTVDTASGTKVLNNGMWKVHVRTGMSDPAADPLILPVANESVGDGYIQDAYVFLRIGDSGDSTRQYGWKPSTSKLETEEDLLKAYNNPLEQTVMGPKASDSVPMPGVSGIEGNQKKGAVGAAPNADGKSAVNHLKHAVHKLKAFDKIKRNGSNSTLTTIADDEAHHDFEEDHHEEVKVNIVKKGPEKQKVPWLLGKEPGPATEKYQKGDGVDIYIDAAMFLPDNVTITRVVAKFFNLEKEPLGQPYECYSSLVSSAINPTYKFKIELRGQSLNTTQTCLLRVDTLDSATMEPQTVGYACFKVFCSKDRVQPKVTGEPNTYLNTGQFQLRIRGMRVPPSDTFDENMLNTMPAIPCSTILVRVRGAPRTEDGLTILSREDVPEKDWEKSGLDVAAPAYTSGEYFGGACEPDEMETYCYPNKEQNLSTTVDGALSLALSSIASKPGAPKFPGRPTAGDDEALVKWVQSLLPKASEMKTLLDYSLISSYSLDSGLCVSIDMLFNMAEIKGGVFSTPPGTLYKVIYSIVPPGLYYKDPPMSEEVVFTKSEDYNRPYRTPVFQDGFAYFFPPLLDNQSYLVIEVRCLTISPADNKALSKQQRNTEPDIKVEPVSVPDKSYWTLMPISKERFTGSGFKYTVSGTFQLPLIKGAIPSSDLFSAETSDPLKELFSRLGPKGKGTSGALGLSDGSSIIVRVCNPIFRKMLPFAARPPEDPDRGPSVAGGLNTDLMSKFMQVASTGTTGSAANISKFTYDMSKFSLAKGEKSTLQRLPGNGVGLDIKKFTKNVNKLFSQKSGINLEA